MLRSKFVPSNKGKLVLNLTASTNARKCKYQQNIAAMSVIRRVMVSRKPKTTVAAPERKLCNYMHRVCLQARIEGYEYCMRHVLEDKTAPFRQCAYTHAQSGRRCAYAAPKTDKRESLCQFHARKALQHRRSSGKKQHLVETPQKVIETLEHYCRDPQHSVDQSDTARNTVKFYDVESDEEPPTIGEIRPYAEGDSDADSLDNDLDDPLRHAGVFTVEEAASITRDKLVRLQRLYLNHFKRLTDILTQKRAQYLRNKASSAPVSKDFASPQEEALYKRYRAYYRYHRTYGPEAVLRARFKRKQKCLSDGIPVTCSQAGCSKRVIPLSRFCRSHILNDRKQQLFERCDGDSNNGQPCSTVMLKVRSPRDVCLIHAAPSPALGCSVTESKGSSENIHVDVESTVDMDIPEIEHFQSMDDIAALGLDVVQPGCLFGLNQFGDPGESTDSALSDDGGTSSIIGLGAPSDILEDVDVVK
ncbi:KAT8 regulatory NSL complex subunit 2 [Dermacentor andersoni]|uniref:KAT8 regulatory NSL complex subunit 2 n=1 Tax=Dermacentor andersoni TaxID=34620 RepID=UPI0021557FF0|nr:KAT8 regulatory NSL complex subunit 2-like [Dermacentor andersoni]